MEHFKRDAKAGEVISAFPSCKPSYNLMGWFLFASRQKSLVVPPQITSLETVETTLFPTALQVKLLNYD